MKTSTAIAASACLTLSVIGLFALISLFSRKVADEIPTNSQLMEVCGSETNCALWKIEDIQFDTLKKGETVGCVSNKRKNSKFCGDYTLRSVLTPPDGLGRVGRKLLNQ